MKTLFIRQNDDGSYAVGDTLAFRDYGPGGQTFPSGAQAMNHMAELLGFQSPHSVEGQCASLLACVGAEKDLALNSNRMTITVYQDEGVIHGVLVTPMDNIAGEYVPRIQLDPPEEPRIVLP